MKFVIHIEGGGSRSSQDAEFRKAWTRFFTKAGIARKRYEIVRGGPRSRTYRSFERSVRIPVPGERPLLLVDSEVPVAGLGNAWNHLVTSVEDKWLKPRGSTDRDAHLMVQCMETWLLADREALATFFGRGWKPGRIPKWPVLENIPKDSVLEALERASEESGKPYRKGTPSFELLASIDPVKVEKACLHAKRLFDVLRGSGPAA